MEEWKWICVPKTKNSLGLLRFVSLLGFTKWLFDTKRYKSLAKNSFHGPPAKKFQLKKNLNKKMCQNLGLMSTIVKVETVRNHSLLKGYWGVY